jgi:metallo-beta-lactamase family protein
VRELARDARFRFVPAGHILGSAMVALELARPAPAPRAERDRAGPLRLLFSGDVGRYGAPLVQDPTPPDPCDVLVVESTYGDRKHPAGPVEEQIARVLAEVVATRGTLLVPAFAVGRSQQLLVLLGRAMAARPELALPVHLDSPMAIDTTALYARYAEERGLEQVALRPGTSPIYGRNVYLHRTREESLRLNDLPGPRVIISSSGMLTGGRVLHHLRRLLPDPANRIMLGGYQAPGTRGWRLARGEPSVRIHGIDVPVRAALAEVSGLSAHADQDELLRWLARLPPPEITFVTHGEPAAARALAARLERERGFRCTVPALGESFEL